MAISETSPYGGPSASNLFCAQAWNANTVYRELPIPSTTSSSASIVTTAALTSSPTAKSISETFATPSIAASTPSEVALAVPNAPSKAWIAGLVIGTVAGVAIIVAGVVIFVSRRQ
ncbi:uncharacterized protein BO97DRAFT_419652 [Aspergillus homomorphus CBS 101889]|uniref:Uncharacterized protein n=1 Tax=Aspergillus homomorphus (strain CBS 101889) TaxID=1450537 RepID=A0A395IE26_ASPHC|nr:hypothetical protein BO97DRAFT_419652 [Aspergillus homomorphus CBS 101889]RAL17413.1 hypothetical protein BO97DRAFT_419652 [Aspergillus homomorphus CBS 101889]